MADLIDLFDNARNEGRRPKLFECVVATTANGLNDELKVTIDGFDGGSLRWPVDGWMPRQSTLPTRGDPGVVALSDEGRLWLLCWMPQ